MGEKVIWFKREMNTNTKNHYSNLYIYLYIIKIYTMYNIYTVHNGKMML